VREQLLRDGDRARARCEHQSRLAVRVSRVHVGPGLEQRRDERCVAGLYRLAERARAEIVFHIGLRAVREQHADELGVEPVRGPMQRRGSVALPRVDVRAGVDELECRSASAALDRVRELAVGARRKRRETDERREPDCDDHGYARCDRRPRANERHGYEPSC
jgi:hypothetical protein